MKRILSVIICLFMTLSIVSGQTLWFRTNAFAMANVYNGVYRWGDWQHSDLQISINTDNDKITVYSPEVQIYRVYDTANNGNAYIDNDGGQTVKFYVIDQDGDRGEVRLRITSNGTSQIYVDFNNVAWVYNVVRIQ